MLTAQFRGNGNSDVVEAVALISWSSNGYYNRKLKNSAPFLHRIYNPYTYIVTYNGCIPKGRKAQEPFIYVPKSL